MDLESHYVTVYLGWQQTTRCKFWMGRFNKARLI